MKYVVESDCMGLGSGFEVVLRPAGYIIDTYHGKTAKRRAEKAAAIMNSTIDEEDRE